MYLYEMMLATMMLFIALFWGYGILVYVLTGIFLSKILKKAGHKTPYASWVPIWNTAALFQLAGLRGAWAWVAVLVGGALLGALLPTVFIGSLITLAVSVFAIIVSVYVFKAIQKATGVGDVGYIILGIFFPWVWTILQANAVERNGYDHAAAFRDIDSFPMNWFGEGDRYGVFLPGVLTVAPAPAPAAPGYAAPTYAPEPSYPAPKSPAPPAQETPLAPPVVPSEAPVASPAIPAENPTVTETATPSNEHPHEELPVAGSVDELLADKDVSSDETTDTTSSDVEKPSDDERLK